VKLLIHQFNRLAVRLVRGLLRGLRQHHHPQGPQCSTLT
jgi:hypothetical protein